MPKVAVLAAPKPVCGHDHPAAEQRVVRVESSHRPTLLRVEHAIDDGPPMAIKMCRNPRPVLPIKPHAKVCVHDNIIRNYASHTHHREEHRQSRGGCTA